MTQEEWICEANRLRLYAQLLEQAVVLYDLKHLHAESQAFHYYRLRRIATDTQQLLKDIVPAEETTRFV
jgi:hypothetical protein